MLRRVRKQRLAGVILFLLIVLGLALRTDQHTTYAPKRTNDRTAPVLRRSDGGVGARDGSLRRNVLDVRRRPVLGGKPVDARAQLEREVIRQLAQMSVNEAWGSRADMIGIWQVTQNIAGRRGRHDPKALRSAQRALSPRVTMVRAPRSRHHREWWTRWLRGDKPPRDLPPRLRWHTDRLDVWRSALRLAARVYAHRAPQRVCRRAVMAWGCNADRYPHCRDPEIAARRRLKRDLSCRGTLNWYYYR